MLVLEPKKTSQMYSRNSTTTAQNACILSFALDSFMFPTSPKVAIGPHRMATWPVAQLADYPVGLDDVVGLIDLIGQLFAWLTSCWPVLGLVGLVGRLPVRQLSRWPLASWPLPNWPVGAIRLRCFEPQRNFQPHWRFQPYRSFQPHRKVRPHWSFQSPSNFQTYRSFQPDWCSKPYWSFQPHFAPSIQTLLGHLAD